MASRTTTRTASTPKALALQKRTRAAVRDTAMPAALPRRATTKAHANGITARASKTTAAISAALNKSGHPKLGKGGLEAAVLDHMAAHPKSEFTPTDLARVLARSGGAIANALAKFAKSGKVVQTSERPRRYRLAGAKAARRPSTKR